MNDVIILDKEIKDFSYDSEYIYVNGEKFKHYRFAPKGIEFHDYLEMKVFFDKEIVIRIKDYKKNFINIDDGYLKVSMPQAEIYGNQKALKNCAELGIEVHKGDDGKLYRYPFDIIVDNVGKSKLEYMCHGELFLVDGTDYYSFIDVHA